MVIGYPFQKARRWSSSETTGHFETYNPLPQFKPRDMHYAERALRLAGVLEEVRMEDGEIVGKLSDQAAREFTARELSGEVLLKAAIEVRYLLKEGTLVKFTTHTRFTVSQLGGKNVELENREMCEFSNIGHSGVMVPPEAKKLLEQ